MRRSRPLQLVVLISGGGTNLQAILDRSESINARVTGVVSDNEAAFGLERARRAGVPTHVIPPEAYKDRDVFDAALIEAIESFDPDLVILAGFMRILNPGVVKRFEAAMLNIHPSLLPKYRGLNTYRKVLAAGDAEHGSSVHFVTEELDGGPVIAQSVVPVLREDDETTLSARVQAQEHILYPTVIGWFSEGRLRLDEQGIYLDDRRLTKPVKL